MSSNHSSHNISVGKEYPLTGTQVHLSLEGSFGSAKAVVTSVGATLREFCVNGKDVIVPFTESELAPCYSGQILAPWPNRLEDGYYEFEGTAYQAYITEIPRYNAKHGIVGYTEWDILKQSDTSATFGLLLPATRGYPFQLLLELTYELHEIDGEVSLDGHLTVRNIGVNNAPFGVGFHPWLSVRNHLLEDATLQIKAATHITVNERLLPTGTEPVAGEKDLNTPDEKLGMRDLDDAFIDVDRDEDGNAYAYLTTPDGDITTMWMDKTYNAWQVCTGNNLPQKIRRFGLAIEPMTCYANAFRTGDLLITLAPNESYSGSWGIRFQEGNK